MTTRESQSTVRSCPSTDELKAWRDALPGRLAGGSFDSHIDICELCQQHLERFDADDPREGELHWIRDLRVSLDGDTLKGGALEADSEYAQVVARLVATSPEAILPEDASRRPGVTDIATLSRDGRYEVLEVLGQGGMGVVYKVRDVKLNRLAAIKVLSPRKLVDPMAAARFRREIRSVARLAHPNIVTAYDADEAGGQQFLVMEFVDGVDLRAMVKTAGPLPFAEAADYILQAARSLSYAHRMGVIHRDVKPANMMRDANGVIKILDLGLSTSGLGDNESCELTETGGLLGTVDFLAPEQAANARQADHRSDIYSLGCSLFYLLTGRPLFDGQSVVQKLLSHREQVPAPLSSASADVPAWAQAIFEKMVAKLPEDRYQDMDELIEDLERQRQPAVDPAPCGKPVRRAISQADVMSHDALPSSFAAVARILPQSLSSKANGGESPSELTNSQKRSIRGRWALTIGLPAVVISAAVSPFALLSKKSLESKPWGSKTGESKPSDSKPHSAAAEESTNSEVARVEATRPAAERESLPLPPLSDSAQPGQWYDVMPLIPAGGPWKKTLEGLFQSPIQPNTVITIPVEIKQSYQWRSEFTRNSGSESVNFYFPVGDRVGVLYFDIEDVDSLVIDDKFGPASPVKSVREPLETGRRYHVIGHVRLMEDEVTLNIELDGRRHLSWSGPKSRLQSTTTSGRFAVGSRDGDTTFHTFHVRLDDDLR
jgi:serine/threonine protein kinase